MALELEKICKAVIKNIKWIITAILVIVFILLAISVKTRDVLVIDSYIYNLISNNTIFNYLTQFIKIFTNLGGTIWLIVLTIFLFIIIKNKKISTFIVTNLCLSASINFIIKQIIRRLRPLEEYRLITEKGYSFPSGHSMVSMAVYGFFIYLINKSIKNKYLKLLCTIILSLLILNIGISRIYLGVHYTTDVVAGFTLGLIYLIFYINFIKKYTTD